MTTYELERNAMRLALEGKDGGLAAYLNGHRRVIDFAAAKRRLRPAREAALSSSEIER
ncbi:hypothetical protein [Bradyrhizobium cytisi]|uniref:hypothetical protein n=1 Tax=Bradyrhizobium cytisi TaxID=515489 RepID=UPI0016530600|nr:hypothetical protein [Bradyrhizobium cytisi]